MNLRLNSRVEGFYPCSQGGLSVPTASGAKIDTDLVIMSVGVRPETSLAKEAGLILGEHRGIRVRFLPHPAFFGITFGCVIVVVCLFIDTQLEDLCRFTSIAINGDTF